MRIEINKYRYNDMCSLTGEGGIEFGWVKTSV